MNKIGWGQLALVLVTSRVFSEATTISETNIQYGMQRYSVVILSFLLTAAAYIPLYILSKRFPEKGVIGAIGEKSPVTAKILGILLIVFILGAMAETFVGLHYYAASTVLEAAPSSLLHLIIFLVCLYALYKGLQATVRTGVLISAAFLGLLLLVLTALAPEIRLRSLYPAFADRPDTFVTELFAEFSKNTEAIIFASLFGRVRSGAGKSVITYLIISCAVLLTMTFLYNTVLGEYLTDVNFPFYTLASISDISVLQRLNGVDVIIWVMAAAVKLALFGAAVWEIITESFGGKWAGFITGGALLGAAALLSLLMASELSLLRLMLVVKNTGLPLIAAGTLIPLAALIMGLAKGKRRAK